MKKTSPLLVIFILTFYFSAAQKIDNLVSFRDIRKDSYFRINYDNDYFSKSDDNYTQGIDFELALPVFKHNPFNYILIKPDNKYLNYGISIESIAYTPNTISSPDIQFGDRPFSSVLFLKNFLVSKNPDKNSRFSVSVSLGIIGPDALGEEGQVAIHKATGTWLPKGWKNQISNDLVLNYDIAYEKELLASSNLYRINTIANLKLGTLFTNVSTGVNAVFGIINSPFSKNATPKKIQCYIFAEPLVKAVAYDATLEGGLFNKSSPYTISPEDVQRITFQYNYGLVIQLYGFYLEYGQSFITKEFKGGPAQNWGGVKLGVVL